MTTTTTVSRLALVGILAIAMAACDRGSSDSTATGTTGSIDTDSPTSSITSIVTDPTTGGTSDWASVDSTTVAHPDSTQVATSVAGPCADFAASGPFGRMLAVEENTAPNDPACADDVTNAEAALQVYRTTQRTFAEGYREQLPDAIRDQGCSADGGQITIENTFDQPVIWWGAGYVTDSDEKVTALYPFISSVSEPGGETTVQPPAEFPGPTGDGICAWDFDAILAPTGDFAADAGLIPAAADDPQASEDPNVWFPALVQHEGSDPALLVNVIEDIHSPDVFPYDFDTDSPDSTAPPTSSADGDEGLAPVLTLCREVPVSQPDGADGQLTMVLYSWARAGAEPSQNVQLGLFRRGTDNRWRFAGRTQTVYEFPESEPRALCDFPVYPLQDLNAADG